MRVTESRATLLRAVVALHVDGQPQGAKEARKGRAPRQGAGARGRPGPSPTPETARRRSARGRRRRRGGRGHIRRRGELGHPEAALRRGPPIPAQKISDLSVAAKAAGCTLSTYTNFGQQHTTATVQYKTNPPTSGPHNPTPAHDGDYVGKGTPVEMLVHALEHDRVEIQYRAGTPLQRRRQLETLLAEPISGQQVGFDQLLFENNTGMPYALAATAWQNLLACPTFTDHVFDALRACRAQYVNKGPEANIPYPE